MPAIMSCACSPEFGLLQRCVESLQIKSVAPHSFASSFSMFLAVMQDDFFLF